MFAIDHAATALILKRRFPSVSLVPLLISVQAMELAWVALNYLGVERTTTEPIVRSVADVHLAYMPYSHSVITACVAAVLVWVVIEKGFHRALLGRAVGIGIVSHLILDVLTHSHDIALAPGIQQIRLGLGLYGSAPFGAFILELFYGILCWRIYKGSRALLALIVAGNLANLSFLSPAIPGPEQYLAGRPTLLVTVILIQIVTTLILVGFLARTRRSYAVDKAVTLEIDGTKQRIRVCSARTGMPPLLIVQAGPGLPLLNEVSKFQQKFDFEQDFTVAYWDQRGCGHAASQDTQNISLKTQIDDLCSVIRWVAQETQQQVVLMGISLGATTAVHAAVSEASKIKSIVAVSMDTDIPASDAGAHAFLKEASAHPGKQKIARLMKRLQPPPYLEPKQFQLRARMLTNLGGIEHGQRFNRVLRSFLYSLISTYGFIGAVAALRNMNAIQRKLLPEIADLNLFANWPGFRIPVHYIFGNEDPLIVSSVVKRFSSVIAKTDTVITLENAGHMAHFDQPAAVRSIIQAQNH